MTSIVERLKNLTPESIKGLGEYFLRPQLRDSWGGALNGQTHRQLMVRQIIDCFAPQYILETGTFRGTTTAFFSDLSDASIRTVERQPRYFWYSRVRMLLKLILSTFR